MALKPWYKVVTPREDLRDGRPLDASEFAVHLDQVRDEQAPDVYQNPEEFFTRTYLTQTLVGLASEVIRRLSGKSVQTSSVFNMATQFGGGKTHALTLLYHLAEHGSDADAWPGVHRLLEKADIDTVPKAATAIFVGTEFDHISGRGGEDGTPLRRTPWGEIAYQLGGREGLAVLTEHEKQMTAPAGDVIRIFLPRDQPCLILMDELMNFVSRSRKSGMAAEFYNFVENLCEVATTSDRLVIVFSIPASELEMTENDVMDYERLKKKIDKYGKAIIMAAERETSEIIRRRLFEWISIPNDGVKTAKEYVDWTLEHRQQLPNWFPVDRARETFEATYPFHPSVLSVFERKWQALPRFQRTRGILRLLALWVSKAYQEGYKGAHRDPLIGLGTAPLDDPLFRAAMFEQLGELGLEVAVTTDIAGKADSHAVRLDKEAVDTIKKARLHRKVATSIFFESNGGQTRDEATLPEIRLAVGEPNLDIGNVEIALETLGTTCYYLTVERNRYRFSLAPNLNKILADRLATIQPNKVNERVRYEVQQVFAKGSGVERVFFPERSIDIPNRPSLTFAVLAPDQVSDDRDGTLRMIESMTKEHGGSARTFKSALIWCVPDAGNAIRNEARKVLAWEDIQYEADDLRFDENQKRRLPESIKGAQRDLRETVWRAYKNVMLLDKSNALHLVDLGLVHSSAADSMVTLILNYLRQYGEVQDGISPNFLVRNWPPAFEEWSTTSVRDAFFASPQFPRLLNGEIVKDTIARGVQNGLLAYVGKDVSGDYEPFIFGEDLSVAEIETSDEAFIITKEVAERYLKDREHVPGPDLGPEAELGTDPEPESSHEPGPGPELGPGSDQEPEPVEATQTLRWTGEVPAQKWMNFYMKVLSGFAADSGLKLMLDVEIAPEGGISNHRVEEMKLALRELGLDDNIDAV